MGFIQPGHTEPLEHGPHQGSGSSWRQGGWPLGREVRRHGNQIWVGQDSTSTLTHRSSQHYEAGTVTVPIIQMRKWRHEDTKDPGPGSPAGKWKSQDLNPSHGQAGDSEKQHKAMQILFPLCPASKSHRAHTQVRTRTSTQLPPARHGSHLSDFSSKQPSFSTLLH